MTNKAQRNNFTLNIDKVVKKEEEEVSFIFQTKLVFLKCNQNFGNNILTIRIGFGDKFSQTLDANFKVKQRRSNSTTLQFSVF
jgi:hypothetical protein